MIRVGEALVDVLLQAVEERRSRVRRVVDWIADVARPPVGVRLVADDGTVYTGILLVEANRPKLMLSLRVGCSGQPAAPTPLERVNQYNRPAYVDELWRRGEDPYP